MRITFGKYSANPSIPTKPASKNEKNCGTHEANFCISTVHGPPEPIAHPFT
jgi:hypothetical protein